MLILNRSLFKPAWLAMCLTILSYQQNPDFPVILISNRDEYYNRPTKTCHFWDDYPNILGGRDLEFGGSWLAVNRDGSLALVTNYREPHLPNSPSYLSRGLIVKDFLLSSEPEKFLKELKSNSDKYQGFNLIVSWELKLFYFSSISHCLIQLQAGLYGLSNHLLDTPWPKLKRAKEKFQALLSQKKTPLRPEPIIELMNDSRRFPDDELPETGIGLELERFLSPIFLVGEQYGTRCTSLLQISRSGRIDFYEQNYDSNGSKRDYIHHYFSTNLT
ncbi:MAG: NRDE family protein [Xenococcaceae cyanobacterium MO_234.B1]|nr:NRDE family protein [Xenococcaceae cyanobacterium MO_234.B1]